MLRRVGSCVLIFTVFFLNLSSSQAWAQSDEQYDQFLKPGKAHAVFKELLGEWQVEQKVWREPGQEPLVMRGVSKRRLIFGGRFLEERLELKGADRQTVFVMIHGYNAWAKEYQTFGYSDYDTAIYSYKGKIDAKTGHWIMNGSYTIDMGGRRMDVGMRSVTKRGKREEVTSIYFVYPQMGEHKAVEIRVWRARERKLY